MTKKKCFVIMPFTERGTYSTGHFSKVYEQIFKPAILDVGFDPYKVDEDKLSHPIVQKVFEGLTKCEMALCDLSSGNPNVLYELGIRHSFDLPVVLVKDDITDFIFDVSGINTIEYNHERLYEHVVEARQRLTEAIKAAEEANKKGTVLRIMQISKADYSLETITSEEKNELLLQQILHEVQKLSPQLTIVENKSKRFYRSEVIKQYHNLQYILQREPSIEELQEVTNYPKKLIEKIIQEVKNININSFENIVNMENENN